MGQRSALRLQLRVSPERADQPRRPQLDGDLGTAEPRGGIVPARLRPSQRSPSPASPARAKAAITQGATENIYSVSNATSRTFGGHTLRFGLQAQFRKFEHLTDNPTRGNFTFNGNFTGNAVADFLLGYCSTCAGAFGASRSTYHSPTIAPFIDDNWQVTRQAEPAARTALGIPRAVGRAERHRRRVRRQPPARSATTRCRPRCPPRWCRSSSTGAAIFPTASSRRTSTTGDRASGGVQPDRPDGRALGVRRLLRQPESERAAVHAADSAVLRTVLAAARRSPRRLQVDTLFPISNNIPQFPAPFSLDPSNRTPYTLQWNVNVQRSLGRDYLVEAAYTGSQQPEPEHKRYNINQADFGTTPINSRLPFPAVPAGDALLVGRRLGEISRACRCASRSATPQGCSSSPTTSCRRTATTAQARSRRTTPRSGPISTPTRACRAITSAIAAPSASATSCRSAKAGAG